MSGLPSNPLLLSSPRVIFTDTVVDPSGSTQTDYTFSKPQEFSVQGMRRKNVNEAFNGKLEHVSFFQRDRITLSWSWFSEADQIVFSRLWRSTWDGQQFDLYRHGTLGAGFPDDGIDPTQRIHKNQWTVVWEEGQQYESVLNQKIYGRYAVSFALLEIIV